MAKLDPAPPTLTGQLTTVKICAVVTTVILTGAALWALRRILEPFVLALFLLIMIDGMARALTHRLKGFPEKAALPAAFVLIAGLFALTIWMATDNAADFSAQAGNYTAKINAQLDLLAQRLGLQVTPTVTDLIHRLNPGRFTGVIAHRLSLFVEAAVFVIIYLGFLVASRQGFAKKAHALFANAEDRAEGQEIFERVRHGVESYMWVQTVVGVVITAISAVAMAATGLSHIPFWCLIIFLANYIPAIGAAVGVLFPAAFGLVEFDSLIRVIVLLAALEATHFAVSHVLQPRLQGRSLNVDPIVVLLSLAFWGVIWGVVGAFLSTPLTVVAMAIMAEFKGTRPLAVLLSSDGRPFADINADKTRPRPTAVG